MTNAIKHRGPDDAGHWYDSEQRIALGHRRLSIIDLSPAGHQPMQSMSGRYVMAFNGEIYNHLELRKELERKGFLQGSHEGAGLRWRGSSDTETLLAGFEAWGIRQTIEHSVGMFAIAVWDRELRVLALLRDRMGEKPLYYGWQGGVFLFGSELKALHAHPAFRSEIDRDSLALLLRHNYIPAPYSIYRGIQKLAPGTYLELRADDYVRRNRSLPEPKSYWTMRQAVERGQADPFFGNEAEAINALQGVLIKSVRQQMVADVPLGAFLSGGIDSSTIVSLMQTQSHRPVKTFSVGFHESGYDEAAHANLVARHLGTEHTELYISPREAMDVIPRLPTIYDEPFSDSSQIPTFLVSQLARRDVTVSISGDAGDELFGGYNRYSWASRIWRSIGWAPQGFRAVLARLATSLSAESWNRLFRGPVTFLPARLHYASPGDKLHKMAEILAARLPEQIYFGLVSHWKHPCDVVLGSREHSTVLIDQASWPESCGFEERMMYLDTITYLPDDILTKVDRAAMAVSLETRIPFLDHRVVEFAWRLPLSMKIRDGKRKWILRQVLYNYVPKQLVDRPKTGFAVPIGSWLRGSLREWAEELLDESRLLQEGYLNPGPIREKWQQHLSGNRNWQYYLWDVLMFQAWLDHFKERPARSFPASCALVS